MAWLVWVRGLRGPTPQILFDAVGDQPYLDSAIKDHVLSKHKLSDDEAVADFAELKKRYPAPAKQEDAA